MCVYVCDFLSPFLIEPAQCFYTVFTFRQRASDMCDGFWAKLRNYGNFYELLNLPLIFHFAAVFRDVIILTFIT